MARKNSLGKGATWKDVNLEKRGFSPVELARRWGLDGNSPGEPCCEDEDTFVRNLVSPDELRSVLSNEEEDSTTYWAMGLREVTPQKRLRRVVHDVWRRARYYAGKYAAADVSLDRLAKAEAALDRAATEVTRAIGAMTAAVVEVGEITTSLRKEDFLYRSGFTGAPPPERTEEDKRLDRLRGLPERGRAKPLPSLIGVVQRGEEIERWVASFKRMEIRGFRVTEAPLADRGFLSPRVFLHLAAAEAYALQFGRTVPRYFKRATGDSVAYPAFLHAILVAVGVEEEGELEFDYDDIFRTLGAPIAKMPGSPLRIQYDFYFELGRLSARDLHKQRDHYLPAIDWTGGVAIYRLPSAEVARRLVGFDSEEFFDTINEPD